ncbi:MAG: BatD family protein [Planctomycetes bacterium]|nr:BatD family protein [Planctomycetota bacterium]
MIAAFLTFAGALCATVVDEPTLTASWSATEVAVGERVSLDVVLRGECAVDAELLELPAIELGTLTLASGPEYSSTDAYRCAWRVDVLARRAGTLRFALRVQCQSADERTVDVPPLAITGGEVIEPVASFALTPSATSVFVGEPFTIDVEIRMGLAAFSTGYELILPWIHDVVRSSTATVLDPVTISIEGESEPMRLTRDDAGDSLVLRTQWRVIVPQAGRLTWAGSRMRPRAQLGTQTSGVDPRIVNTQPGGLDVLSLPQSDRPRGHVDAIGVWSVRSRADRVDVVVGEPVRVEVVIEASEQDAGNLAFATLPSAWAIEDGEAMLRDERRDALARVLTFEVRATRPGAMLVPAFEVPVFDARARRYAVARSAPIPLRVEAPVTPTTPLVADEPGALWTWIVVSGGGVGALVLAWGAVRRVRARRDHALLADPRYAFERASAACASDDPLRASKALAHACAAAVGIEVGALGGGGARTALRDAGVGAALVERCAGLVEADEAAAFASPRARDARDDEQRLAEARDLVEALLRERST